MTDRLVLVVTSPRVAPGVLTLAAWEALRASPVLVGRPDHPQLPALAAADVPVSVVEVAGPVARARTLRERARESGAAVWLAEPGGDEELARAVAGLALEEPATVEIEIVSGSYDLPGARLLDVVATMDRLRSPAGCPWDARQTHESLARYLLEEAYEAFEAIETGSYDDLCEEIGDVLLQVVFHARVAQERGVEGWDIDDVARVLVDKLVRRHPHVFAAVTVTGADEVQRNWDDIKAAESASAVAGVPLGQPALALAAQLQKRAGGVGLTPELWSGAASTFVQEVSGAAARVDEDEPEAAVGDLLFAAVALARARGVDPEIALRARARAFRDRLAALEADLRADGLDPRDLGPAEWREKWGAAQPRAVR